MGEGVGEEREREGGGERRGTRPGNTLTHSHNNLPPLTNNTYHYMYTQLQGLFV